MEWAIKFLAFLAITALAIWLEQYPDVGVADVQQVMSR
jgi:hypothetical protein